MGDWMAALDAQLELIQWWRSDKGMAWATYLAHRYEIGEEEAVELLNFTAAFLAAGKSAGLNHHKIRREYEDRKEQVRKGFELAHDLANGLNRAATYWVSPEMSRFVFHAHRDIPPCPLDFADLPAPRGFVFFAEPLEFESTSTGKPLPIRIIDWNWYEKRDSSVDIATYRDHPTRRGHAVAQLSMWREGIVPPGTLAKLLQAFWVLSGQRIASAEQRPVERHGRRRADRVGFTIPEDGIQVVTLRRPATSPTGPAVASLVEWSHRWIVSGHWRNQWYPASEEHRPKWIEAYPKGPEDKPLVLKDRVYRWVR